MLDKELGKNYPIDEREAFLRNVSDGTETMSYARQLTSEELAKERELLTDACIMIADINEAKKAAMQNFKDQAKEYEEQRLRAIKNLRMKAEIVEEECFKVFDEETKMVGFYNSEGTLVNSRPAFHNEFQKTIFADFRKNGTEDK